MSWARRNVLAVVGSAATAFAGCAGTEDQSDPEPGDTTDRPDRPTPPQSGAAYGYTHLRASGNRVVSGTGAVDDAQPVTIEVDSRPEWLLAFGDGASFWTVVTADGTATTHRVGNGASEEVGGTGGVSTPPLAYFADGQVGFVVPPSDCAEHTHPVVIDDGVLYVANDGDLVIRRDERESRFDVQAPTDVRLARIDDSRYALYGGRTDRYRHGALGDAIEGSSLIVVDVAAESVAVEVGLESPAVFEGLSPLVADLDGDGEPELVTTVADSAGGARIRVYDTRGTELATGPIHGSGWRHQLCVAPFGPASAPELAVVRKPHVERTAEFYRLAAGRLAVTATRQGYASHTYGSRNLDGGLAADLDDDGRTELLVPATDRRTLEAVRRVDGGVRAAWSLPLGGSLATNVTGVALGGGRLAVGAGTVDGVRVWQG
jgi:hypothetical protein